MPGFDGTGPLGKGPMTGRCRGFCVLKTSEQKPAGVEGFAGINGKPVADVAESQSGQGKEVTAMPGGDGTGPAGLGPMTGRAAGFCAGYGVPGYMNPIAGRLGFYGWRVPAFGPYGARPFGYGGWFNPLIGALSWPRRIRGIGLGWGRGRGRGRGRFAFAW